MPLARSMEAVFQAPPAASYERLLIEMGYESVEARIRSRWILTNGGRWAKDLDVSRRKLASALREIVKAADQSPLVMGRRAAVLLPLLDNWTRPKTSGIAGSPLWFPDLDDGRVAVLPDISRARARPLARGGLSTKARSRSASRAEQTRLTSI